jgi:flagellar hook-associated protein 2
MARVETRYRAQFNALDSLLSRLQSSSTFLTQQLDSISKISRDK